MTAESEPVVGIFTKFEAICSFKIVLILIAVVSLSKANQKSSV